MQLDEAIKTRRSIKNYSSKKPDWRDIIECIDAARYAPMAGNVFTPRFILIDSQKKIEKIAEACEQDFVGKVDYIIVVCSESKLTKNAFGERGERYIKQQAGAAIQNLLLKLQEKGLATCWIGHFVDDMIKNELNIKEDIDIEAIFPIAYPTKKIGKLREKQKIEMDRILYFNKWGNKKMKLTKTLNV